MAGMAFGITDHCGPFAQSAAAGEMKANASLARA